jgi:hypothetical protein
MNAPLFTRDARALEHRDVQGRPATWNADARTIDCIVATATPVQRQDQRGSYDEVLDPRGADLSAFTGAHVLNGHRQGGVEDVIGSVERAWVEGDQLLATVRFSTRPEVEGIVNDIAAGIIRGVSVGYEVSQWQDGEASGVRTRTATKWKPRELSFVAVSADPHARTRHATRADTNRAIRDLGLRCGMPQAAVDDLIDREASIEQARAAMLDHLTTRGSVSIRTAHNEQTLDNPAAFVRAAGEALYARINPNHQLSAPARQLSAITSLADAARECLRRNGDHLLNTSGSSAVAITRALQTTSDYPLLLGNVMGRTLRAAYQAAPSALRRLARSVTAPDFRERSSLVLDTGGFDLEKVNEHGEYKSGSFVEGGEKYKLATYGKIFGITRQALINDDLGALADIPAKLGARAAAFESQYLVDLLEGATGVGPVMSSDSKALFHTDHGNLAGAGAAPSDTTLTAARLAMRKQTSPGGELLDIVPRFLVVPPDIETDTIKVLTAIQATQVSDVNVWSSLLDLMVEPRLTDSGRWYLSADAPASGLEVCYLTGAEGPQTETQAGWRIDGVETKVRLDFVAAWIDWRGIYQNPGA